MQIAERIESINNQLIDIYGIDTITGLPLWRVVFSDDQLEKRLGTYDDFSPAGLYLRTVTEVREVYKYKQWIKSKFVLENLVIVPEMNQPELPTQKLSYEPIYVFQTGSGEYLPPRLDACQFIINSIYAVKGKGNLAKYKAPEDGLTGQDLIDYNNGRIAKLQDELFGNESYVGDALAHNEAIVVPSSYQKES